MSKIELWEHNYGVKIYDFLRKWDYDEKMQTVMRERRAAVEQRAIDSELGSSDDCKWIHHSVYVLWNTLAEQPKPLTDSAWNTLLPTIKLTLEQSRLQKYLFVEKLRRRRCSKRLGELWLEVGSNPGQLGPIVAALGVRAMPSSSALSDEMRRVMLTPFPNIEDGLKWEFMGTFREAEYGINRTEGHFASVLVQIQTRVPRWIDQVEKDLVRLLSIGLRAKRLGDNPVLTVKGSTGPTAHLPEVTRRLLRADCVFKASDEHPLFGVLHSGSDHAVPISLFYPDLLITHRDKAWNPEWFQIHLEASRAAKVLLACLDMQDAAHAEMKAMGCRFVCGRCSDGRARDWSGM
ncbi:hypothetical protein FRC10_008936, partial [Ceratobasidium sp. 414]